MKSETPYEGCTLEMMIDRHAQLATKHYYLLTWCAITCSLLKQLYLEFKIKGDDYVKAKERVDAYEKIIQS